MSDLFNNNLNYLRQYRVDLYEEVKAKLNEPSIYDIVFAKNGSPNIEIKHNQMRSVYMYSKYNPEHECMRWAENIHHDDTSQLDVIMYGVGLTHHLASYLKCYPNHQLYLYEPSVEVFIESLKVISLDELMSHRNIRYLAVGEQESEVGGLIYNYYTYATLNGGVVTVPFYVNDDPERYQQFIGNMQKYIYNLKSQEQYMNNFGYYLQRNMFRNVSQVLKTPSLNYYKNIWQGKSVVIVGSGPSLEKDINFLKENGDNYIIVAAGTSIQPLLKNNIQPHLAVTMDTLIFNYEAFAKADLSQVPLLFIPTVEYRIPQLESKARIHAFYDHLKEYKYLLNLNDDDPVFIGSHSVTGTAIQAAIYMGAKRIIFTGQDLSYPGYTIYTGGTEHLSQESLDLTRKEMTETVENVDNTYNATTIKMNITLQDIEDLLSKYDDVEFINCSQGGAKIKGTTYQLLHELIPPNSIYTRENFIEELNKKTGRYDNTIVDCVENRLKDQQNWLKQSMYELNIILKHLLKLEALSRTNPNKCNKNIAEIEQLWGSIVLHQNYALLIEGMLVINLRNLDKSVPLIQVEQNLIKKAKMLREALEPVVRKSIDIARITIEFIDISLENIACMDLGKMVSVDDDQSH